MKYLYFLLLLFYSTSIYGQSNQYIHFDGVDDYVATAEASQYIANINQISMTGWFNSDVLRYGSGMMGFRGEGTGSGAFYILQLNNGKLECRLQTDAGTFDVPNPDGTISANQWHHIAFVYNGSIVEAWIDGVSIGTAAASGVIQSTDKPFGIGKSLVNGYNFLYQGKADEITLWSKALNQTEINEIIANELVGDELNLELYYKCNQGYPDNNNTSINKLYSETGNDLRNGDITNLELLGNTSNFGGTLNTGVQAISFPQISNKTTLDNDFSLIATATSGLDVSFEIVSGPASISGSIISLTGDAGLVFVKAKQLGNSSYSAADEIISNFQVLDPQSILSEIEILNPIDGNVYASSLSAIQIAAKIDIAYPELFDVSNVVFKIDNQKVGIKNWGNSHYTAWWTPSDYGTYELKVEATNNYGVAYTKTINFTVLDITSDITVDAFTDIWVNGNVSSLEAQGILPSYVGSFDEIIGTLDIVCPAGGCDPWDRISSIEAQGFNGEWYQIIRYLTPYGVACSHQIDLTDFKSLLQGKTKFRVNLGTQGNGFEYNLSLAYHAGTPNYKYSTVDKLWQETYPFGDYGDIQPCEVFDFQYKENTEASTLKLVSTGHGWGNLNSGNAAEFHEDTHHIWVNGSETFTQHNWKVCNPNPDDCSPQSGTWQYSRAGWCPGSIAQFYDYDMTSHISSNVELKYIFNENYVDLCHPNHPDCITGSTCSDCNSGFNPHLVVKSYIISKSNSPYNIDTTYSKINKIEEESIDFSVYPNPTLGKFHIDISKFNNKKVSITILDYQAKEIHNYIIKKNKKSFYLDISNQAKGIYLVKVTSETKNYSKLIVLE